SPTGDGSFAGWRARSASGSDDHDASSRGVKRSGRRGPTQAHSPRTSRRARPTRRPRTEEGCDRRCCRLNRDFWKYWIGETISNFGNSVTQFALPLIVFKLTGSALALGATLAIYTAPQLFFGLAIGAWTDRTDRKRLMIVVDLLSAVTIASVAVASAAGLLSPWWIYAVVFVSSTLSILFVAAEFGPIPSLVDSGELATANGPIQASLAARVCARPARCRGRSRPRARRGGLAPRRRVI